MHVQIMRSLLLQEVSRTERLQKEFVERRYSYELSFFERDVLRRWNMSFDEYLCALNELLDSQEN